MPYRLEDERTYATFLADYRLPAEFVESELPFWAARWVAMMPGVVFLVCSSSGRPWRSPSGSGLLRYRKLVHITVGTLAAVGAGLVLKAQPSTTQILTLAGSAVERRFRRRSSSRSR